MIRETTRRGPGVRRHSPGATEIRAFEHWILRVVELLNEQQSLNERVINDDWADDIALRTSAPQKSALADSARRLVSASDEFHRATSVLRSRVRRLAVLLDAQLSDSDWDSSDEDGSDRGVADSDVDTVVSRDELAARRSASDNSDVEGIDDRVDARFSSRD